jgi:AcrR family transcriptional regulator
MDKTSERQDGRHARRERNKSSIVDALLEYVHEKGEIPTADALAQQAKVSRRTLFRLFGDKATIRREASNSLRRQLLERFPFPDPVDLPLSDRIDRFVTHLASIYEFVTPLRRASAKAKLDQVMPLDEPADSGGSRYRNRIINALVEQGAEPILQDALHLLISWNTWEYLRSEREHSISHAKDVVIHAITALLCEQGVSETAKPGRAETE